MSKSARMSPFLLKQKTLIPSWVSICGCILLLCTLQTSEAEANGLRGIAISKRQARLDSDSAQTGGKPTTVAAANARGDATASAISTSASSALANAESQADVEPPKRMKARPIGIDQLPALGDLGQPDQTASSRPQRKRRPQAARRPAHRDDYDQGNEDCYDDDYGDLFHNAATRPMRQIGQMMGSVFERMQDGFSSFNRFPAGGNLAVASSSVSHDYDGNDDDGYSRTSSFVSNNGRTRGLVAETQNGRTKFRRIGNDNDGSDEYED